jgi:hypothetical protein
MPRESDIVNTFSKVVFCRHHQNLSDLGYRSPSAAFRSPQLSYYSGTRVSERHNKRRASLRTPFQSSNFDFQSLLFLFFPFLHLIASQHPPKACALTAQNALYASGSFARRADSRSGYLFAPRAFKAITPCFQFLTIRDIHPTTCKKHPNNHLPIIIRLHQRHLPLRLHLTQVAGEIKIRREIT